MPLVIASEHSAIASLAARQAVRALYVEITLEPKPGLVSLRDNGSHKDMTAATFVRSLFALRHYFAAIAQAGFEGRDFTDLQRLGVAAEARMLQATRGVNTHRGVIFALGLLCAAAGRLCADNVRLQPEQLRRILCETWGEALRERALAEASQGPRSNGQRAARRFGLRSATREAADAFPTLFEVTLPVLQHALASGLQPRAARVQALFATMAVLDDTNLAHRGGREGLQRVKECAAMFLSQGGVLQADWLERARLVHARLVADRLSPGGCADMLACACWIQGICVDGP